MMLPKVGLITFGDHRPDMWKKVFAAHTEPMHQTVIDTLSRLPVELIISCQVARTREQINDAVDELKRQKVEILVAHVPAWTSPNLVVHGIQRMGLHAVIVGNRSPATHGCVGVLGAAGTLSQIQWPHHVLRADYDEGIYREKLLPLFRAAAAKARLQGSVFALFGGRSIGIDTATFDPMQWRTLFGIDAEHFDQYEIIRRSGLVDRERIAKMRTWMLGSVHEVRYEEPLFSQEKLDYQIACYLATKDMVEEYALDFVAIKCMPELSTHEVPQCMTQAFLACNEDAEGKKPSTAIACEADADGALTQHILRIISGGKPTLFADVSHINDEKSIIYCVNCGAICAYYGARSSCMENNLGCIALRRSVRPGGGGITYFNASPGPVQLARLYRVAGKYHMAIMEADAVTPTQEMVDEFVKARGPHQLPALFAKVEINIEKFVSNYGSNHISGVEGHYMKELIAFCEMAGIVPEVYQ